MNQQAKETARRRTFAIISHPDAGKTTLTEKFLLYGGAKDLAGSVRDRKNASETSSDWLELEKQRGISVSSTVLQFEYKDYRVNLLDTPGHRDFSEDTYRVLTAVDAAIMVLDAAKGIEEQTLKLFEVCRSRGIPIITFINKCDRPGRDPLEILDEVETTLGLQTFAINWPIGQGNDFHGLYDRVTNKVHWFERVAGGRKRASVKVGSLDDDWADDDLPSNVLSELRDSVALLEGAGSTLDHDLVLRGELTPVYFGSAINNFGVELLLDGFLSHAPEPQPRHASRQAIPTGHPAFSAFIFKIQANMDPNHRDRLVFLRVCSGRFQRDIRVKHAQSGKALRLSFSHQLFGRERETQDEAFPGDILGITGQSGLDIGDTITEDSAIVYDPIPRFAPESYIYLHNNDTLNFKRFRAGLAQLLQEKVVQQFFPVDAIARVPLLGAVGPLQFDVVRYRLESEYGASTRSEQAPWTITRWVDPSINLETLSACYLSGACLARDEGENLAILFQSSWNLDYFIRENPKINLRATPWPTLQPA